jgi:selenocysteine lyase/cysteine desulfurase
LGASPFVVTETVKTKMDREETYPSAGHNADDWREIRAKCASLLGPGCRKEEIALTSTATEGINIVVNGLPLQRGDEVITSTHEHVALNVPLLNKMKTKGIAIRTFKPDLAAGGANLDRIESLITQQTRLIFISHNTCTTGQLFPVREIGAMAKSRGIWFALDGAQSLAHLPIDIKDIGADFYAASGHKWLLGPKRTGVLYLREDLLEILKPSIVGAYSDEMNDMEKRLLKFHPTAQRYEFGTQNDALIYGLGKAVDFVSAIGLEAIWKHNRRLTELFYSGLQGIPEAEILSPAEEEYRSSMITFRLKGRDNSKISSSLTGKRLRVRTVGEANIDGIRVSFHIYNNEREVQKLLEEIGNIASKTWQIRG